MKGGVNAADVNAADVDPPDDQSCALGCSQPHSFVMCPAFKKMKIKERWDVVIKWKWCKKCLKGGDKHQQCSRKACDVNSCGRPHHYLLHKEKMDPNALNPKAPPFNSNGPSQHSGGVNKVGAISINTSGTAHVPVQKIKVRNATGVPVEGLAMIDSGSNQTLVRREFAEKLELVGETRRMKMHVAGGGVKIEDSAVIEF